MYLTCSVCVRRPFWIKLLFKRKSASYLICLHKGIVARQALRDSTMEFLLCFTTLGLCTYYRKQKGHKIMDLIRSVNTAAIMNNSFGHTTHIKTDTLSRIKKYIQQIFINNF